MTRSWADRLAISRAAAYRLVRSGQLQDLEVGETWRVLRADFEAYVEARRAEAERRYRAAPGRILMAAIIEEETRSGRGSGRNGRVWYRIPDAQ
jgi:excisionase family DNA binding protein